MTTTTEEEVMQKIAPNYGTDNGRERRTMDEGGFQWQPNAIRSYRKVLGVHALAVYEDLTGRVLSKNKPGKNLPLQECKVLQEDIAEDLAISVREVRRSIGKLKDHGIIEVIPPKKHREASTYILLRFGRCARTPKTGSYVQSTASFDAVEAQSESCSKTPTPPLQTPDLVTFDVANAQGDRTGSPPSDRTGSPVKYLRVLKALRVPLSSVPQRGTIPTPAKNAGAGTQVPVSPPEVSLPSEKPRPEEVEQLRKDIEDHFTARGGYTVSAIEDLRCQLAGKTAVLEQALLAIAEEYGPPHGFVN